MAAVEATEDSSASDSSASDPQCDLESMERPDPCHQQQRKHPGLRTATAGGSRQQHCDDLESDACHRLLAMRALWEWRPLAMAPTGLWAATVDGRHWDQQ